MTLTDDELRRFGNRVRLGESFSTEDVELLLDHIEALQRHLGRLNAIGFAPVDEED